MKFYSDPPPKIGAKPSGWYNASHAGHDMFGRVYMLNLTRPASLCRRIRARIGWHEKDTMRSGLTHKPTIKKDRLCFDGTQSMRPMKLPK